MPYRRSLPAETLARLEAEIRLQLPGADPQLRYSAERVLARVIAMASYEMEGYIEYVSRQILPTTCDPDFLPVHAYLWNVPQRAASFAVGQAAFTGTNGVTVPAGTSLRRQDGQEYTLDADAITAGGAAIGSITAVTAGAAGNAPSATQLTLTSPVAGIQSAATVVTPGASGGVDIEDVEVWRERIVARIQRPPHGGNHADYEAWAKEVAGVTRVWVYPNRLGRGSVYLLFVMDEKEETIIPSPVEVETVNNYINLPSIRPVTADVTVAAPTPVAVDFTINISPNSVVVQNAIAIELADLIRRESTPGGTLLLSHIHEAISVAAGEVDHVLVMPSANISRAFGEISVVGNITFGSI
ncbi:MAG: baseplate J/gp47 family protein [Alphaproteobacteria bacterium]|nr:baseplate J/gp47 family protein [Alphaproteobacteria bacterium]